MSIVSYTLQDDVRVKGSEREVDKTESNGGKALGVISLNSLFITCNCLFSPRQQIVSFYATIIKLKAFISFLAT